MALVRVGDTSFNIEVEGPPKAPFVMLSNSLGTNLHMWDPQMPALTRHFRVIRYDSRGHGRSYADEGPYSIASLGRDALAIMETLGVSKTSWVGLSKGGMVGQWLLVNAPHRIDRAVLANTAARMGSPDLWNARIRTAKEKGMAALAGATIERWFTPEFRRSDPDTIEKILAALILTPPQGYAACCAAIRDMDQREAIRAIAKPVLVIIGQHDPATPPILGKQMASSIPGAQKITLEAAHLSNIEDAENFTRAVLEFLTGKEISKPGPRVLKAPPKKAPAPKAEASTAQARTPAVKKPATRQAAGKPAAVKKRAAAKPAAKKVMRKSPAGKTSSAKAKQKTSAGKAAKNKSAAKKKKAR